MDGGVHVLFPTGLFVVFFVVVFAVSWALARRPLAWKLFILVASYVFYAGWGWKFTLLLGGYTLVNYSCSQTAKEDTHRTWRIPPASGGWCAKEMASI
jgi:alginate O-acetyltransferase complex protein AlgI